MCLVTRLCPTLCDPMNSSPPGPTVAWQATVHGVAKELDVTE